MISFAGHEGVDPTDVLGDDGLVAKAYPPFEVRPQQIQMAVAVQNAFAQGHHLAVEAGTGTGKSFAYLVPAIDQVVQKHGKVLISTYTITLQQQLINKDVPFLAEILDCDFKASLAKGRGNYICLRRLKYAAQKERMLFNDMGMELVRLLDWAVTTKDGSLSDLEMAPAPAVWDAVKSEHGNCRQRKCPHFNDCFYFKARRDLDTADIIVANHALMFSDLVLRSKGLGILPDYNFIVVDEAHNMEHVAEDHFGINMSNYTFTYLLNGLYNPKNRKGLLAFNDNGKAIELVKECNEAVKIFFTQIQAWYDNSYRETNGKCHPSFVDDNITEPIKQLRLQINKIAKDTEDENDDKLELGRYVERLRDLEVQLQAFIKQPDEQSVYWVEKGQSVRLRIALRSAPLEVGPYIKECLFDSFNSVITTSATLSCHGEDDHAGFEFFAERIGLEDFQQLKLGSPFDYEQLVTMYIEANLPEPNHPDFKRNAAEAIKKYLTQTDGSAFVLFTSYSMLRSMSDMLTDWLAENNMTRLVQGGGVDRSTLLEQFKQDHHSVLFGTDSFWQGVDVPGASLSNVIIVRLPFAVPNHPLVQGRIELMKSKGENPFYKFQLPSAIIKFKQGFGRLVRKKTDSGIVVILDSRVLRKSYGRSFFNAIPKCRVEVVND